MSEPPLHAPAELGETFNWHRADYDLYSVWPLNQAWTMHVAVAMTHDPLADGHVLIGYFALSSS